MTNWRPVRNLTWCLEEEKEEGTKFSHGGGHKANREEAKNGISDGFGVINEKKGAPEYR